MSVAIPAPVHCTLTMASVFTFPYSVRAYRAVTVLYLYCSLQVCPILCLCTDDDDDDSLFH